MPFVDPNNVSENPYAEEVHLAESGSAALTGANENLIYDYPDWEDPDLAAAAQGGSPPVTVLNQTGGYATIRLNRDLYLQRKHLVPGAGVGHDRERLHVHRARSKWQWHPRLVRAPDARGQNPLRNLGAPRPTGPDAARGVSPSVNLTDIKTSLYPQICLLRLPCPCFAHG